VDAVFAHIIVLKFNKDALNLYESHVFIFKEFLQQRLSSISSFPQENELVRKEFQSKSNKENCSCCNVPTHNITQCYKFIGMDPAERYDWAKKDTFLLSV